MVLNEIGNIENKETCKAKNEDADECSLELCSWFRRGFCKLSHVSVSLSHSFSFWENLSNYRFNLRGNSKTTFAI